MPPARRAHDPFTDTALRPSKTSSHNLRAQASLASTASSRSRQQNNLFAPSLSRRPTSRATPSFEDEVLADEDEEEEFAAGRGVEQMPQRRHRLRHTKVRHGSPESKHSRLQKAKKESEEDFMKRRADGGYLNDIPDMAAALAEHLESPEMTEEAEVRVMDEVQSDTVRTYFTTAPAGGIRASEKHEQGMPIFALGRHCWTDCLQYSKSTFLTSQHDCDTMCSPNWKTNDGNGSRQILSEKVTPSDSFTWHSSLAENAERSIFSNQAHIVSSKTVLSPPRVCDLQRLIWLSSPNDNMSPPSKPPPAYVQASSSRHGHSDEDIPLPPYESHLFANYEAGRKNPVAHAAEFPDHSSLHVEAQSQVPNVVANAVDLRAAEAHAARKRLNSQLSYSMITLATAAACIIFFVWMFARAPGRTEEEAQG